MSGIREFVKPPECPVYYPKLAEWDDPLAFIAKVRPDAEKYGICKIVPPPEWQPPFAIDVDNFIFTPRRQRLNELEGSHLRLPNVERRVLDLYKLHKIVTDEGGFETVSYERKWTRVASRMGYEPGKGVGSLLKGHYERILYPYDIFKSGPSQRKEDVLVAKVERLICKDIPLRKQGCATVTRSLEAGSQDSRDSHRLAEVKQEPSEIEEKPEVAVKTPKKKGKQRSKQYPPSIADKYFCLTCGRGDAEDQMLLCDGCDDSYHTFCLIPPLSDIPKGDWRCPKCVKQACEKPREAFGFEQAKREYTLQSFGEMADAFKSDYFHTPVHMVPPDTVETEFWRLTRAVDEDVVVEYGADLSTLEKGSGFPTRETADQFQGEEQYIESPWNLNNLAVMDNSILRYITADISGMKVPWVYVGMCFSTFCWHTEDHWSYSINYMHWGEPKTWYGVPGSSAELLEQAMRDQAPELFEAQPDLMHQLVTIMHPNLLMEKGVPVHKTNQQAGEFVVTFPRAYHAGFNQGYNCAEAVNFCPPDWFDFGRRSISHYRMHRRYCVFSHDEVLCNLGNNPGDINVELAEVAYDGLRMLIAEETALRRKLEEKGKVNAKKKLFELLPDDERICFHCNTTCYLSALTCECRPDVLACLYHADKLCDCPLSKKWLNYRLELDELLPYVETLKRRKELLLRWSEAAASVLASQGDDRPSVGELRDLLQEWEREHYSRKAGARPRELRAALDAAATDADRCSILAQQLVSRRVRTRHRHSGEQKYTSSGRLTLAEAQQFYEQICRLSCEIAEHAQIKDLLQRAQNFQTKARGTLQDEVPNSERLHHMLDEGLSLDIELPEISALKQQLQQACWLEEVGEAMPAGAAAGSDQRDDRPSLNSLRRLIDAGVNQAPHPAVERAMARLQQLLTVGEAWEERASAALRARPPRTVAALEAIVAGAEQAAPPLALPAVHAVREALRKARDWTRKAEAARVAVHPPYIEALEVLATRGRPLPVALDALAEIDGAAVEARAWREQAALAFLKRNCDRLLEVLLPRREFGRDGAPAGRRPGKKRGRDSETAADIVFDCSRSTADVVEAYTRGEAREIAAMTELRARNRHKYNEDGRSSGGSGGGGGGGSGRALYCICRKPHSEAMLRCELCQDWFHSTCVPPPQQRSIGKPRTATVQRGTRERGGGGSGYLCSRCMRTRRPRLNAVLALIVTLQRLPVRVAEGEALQCLTERAIRWQSRAKKLMATGEVATVVSTMENGWQVAPPTASVQTPASAAAAAAADMPPRLSCEVGDRPAETGARVREEEEEEDGCRDGGGSGGGSTVTQQLVLDIGSSASDRPPTLSPAIDRGYSPRACASPTAPHGVAGSGGALSVTLEHQLDDVLMQGNLLEVALDELEQLRYVLQASRHAAETRHEPVKVPPDLPSPTITAEPSKPKKKQVKRTSDEDTAIGNKRTSDDDTGTANRRTSDNNACIGNKRTSDDDGGGSKRKLKKSAVDAASRPDAGDEIQIHVNAAETLAEVRLKKSKKHKLKPGVTEIQGHVEVKGHDDDDGPKRQRLTVVAGEEEAALDNRKPCSPTDSKKKKKKKKVVEGGGGGGGGGGGASAEAGHAKKKKKKRCASLSEDLRPTPPPPPPACNGHAKLSQKTSQKTGSRKDATKPPSPSQTSTGKLKHKSAMQAAAPPAGGRTVAASLSRLKTTITKKKKKKKKKTSMKTNVENGLDGKDPVALEREEDVEKEVSELRSGKGPRLLSVSSDTSREDDSLKIEESKGNKRTVNGRQDDNGTARSGSKKEQKSERKHTSVAEHASLPHDTEQARDEEEEEEDDEDPCSADTCLINGNHHHHQPQQKNGSSSSSGGGEEEVHWVQCDGGCDLWFHLGCVGLGATDLQENEDYVCSRCSGGSPNHAPKMAACVDDAQVSGSATPDTAEEKEVGTEEEKVVGEGEEEEEEEEGEAVATATNASVKYASVDSLVRTIEAVATGDDKPLLQPAPSGEMDDASVAETLIALASHSPQRAPPSQEPLDLSVSRPPAPSRPPLDTESASETAATTTKSAVTSPRGAPLRGDSASPRSEGESREVSVVGNAHTREPAEQQRRRPAVEFFTSDQHRAIIGSIIGSALKPAGARGCELAGDAGKPAELKPSVAAGDVSSSSSSSPRTGRGDRYPVIGSFLKQTAEKYRPTSVKPSPAAAPPSASPAPPSSRPAAAQQKPSPPPQLTVAPSPAAALVGPPVGGLLSLGNAVAAASPAKPPAASPYKPGVELAASEGKLAASEGKLAAMTTAATAVELSLGSSASMKRNLFEEMDIN
ncbi:PREDICTED: lysine-specific demethylase 5B-like [Priapulus caudatus]|uniref:[histone H3]-trimethyl-L-lysine(4) demethylase n=1 Tax=Priapulus caudatus TaxID=37621 RepID=A0ABM1E600_PRICU|nr:PREDICTED: lysine-specific demethylase 5B-like [Priapulus caudatus]